ncbi:MAG: HAMP domain-containing protein, partial [bacterium]|nr:HAMP domain-containing protein [bacterium]
MKKFFSSLFGKYMLIFIGVLLLTNVMASAIAVILFSIGQQPVIDNISGTNEIPILFVFRMGVVSMIIGTTFIFFATKIVVKPIKDLSDAAKRVANGDFNVELAISRKGHDEISELT